MLRPTLILGATGSLGRVVAHHFAAAGYPLVLVGRRLELLHILRSEIGQADATCLTLNLTNVDELQPFVQQLSDTHPRLSVVLNCTGAFRGGEFVQLPLVDVEMLLMTNLVGPILLTHELLPLLRSNAPADLVHVTSSHALTPEGYSGDTLPYTTTKRALHEFCLALAPIEATRGVRVTTVALPTLENSHPSGLTMERVAEVLLHTVAAPLDLHPQSIDLGAS